MCHSGPRLRARSRPDRAQIAPGLSPLGPGRLPPCRWRPRDRSGGKARRDVIEAVGSFRSAGFFARYNARSNEELARMANAGWRERDGEDLPTEALELDLALIVLDEDRTLSDDPEADVTEGAGAYRELLRGLARRSSGALQLGAVEEDWGAGPQEVLVVFEANGRKVHARVNGLTDWLGPHLVVQLNEVLGDRRVWFVDAGGQDMILTWASNDERARLEAARPVRLSGRPPEWWLAELA